MYDMDSIDGINKIPVPAENYKTGDPTKDCIYYLLQRKATEHKKSGNIELAIACLRKSNELSDNEQHPLLTQKEYLRLIKYIELSGNTALAEKELESIYSIHPEFMDKRISNLNRIKETLTKCQEHKYDLVMVVTNSNCSVCKEYNSKIFSISGKSKIYPKLPEAISINGGLCPDCYIAINAYLDNFPTKQGGDNVRICPKCHNSDIQYQTVTGSRSTGCLTVLLYIFLAISCIGWLILIPLLLRKKDCTVTYAVCQSCGYRWKI